MLTKEQLDPKLYPREFWLNVYHYPKLKDYCYGHKTTLEKCIEYANSYPPNNYGKLVYRIHVRLK